MRYAQKLTLAPGDMQQSDVEDLHEVGLDDGQILEANQIIGHFNYANFSLNDLDVVGYCASKDADKDD